MGYEQKPNKNTLNRLFERSKNTSDKLKFFIGAVATSAFVESYMSLKPPSERVALTDALLIGGMIAVKNKFSNRQSNQIPQPEYISREVQSVANPNYVNPFAQEPVQLPPKTTEVK